MKRFLSILLVIALCFLVSCENGGTNMSSMVDADSGTSSTVNEITNVALSKRVRASIESNDYKSYNITDGNAKSIWATGKCETNLNEWIYVDLGENIDISTIKINWGNAGATSYKVLYSRGGIEYTELFSSSSATTMDEKSFETPLVARYIKIEIGGANPAFKDLVGVTISELEVFGVVSADQTLASETEKMVGTSVVPLDSTNSYVSGRNYNYNELNWQGSEIDFEVSGGSVIGIVATTYNHIISLSCSIDGGEWFEYTLGSDSVQREYIIAEGLEDKKHTVRIVRSSHAGVSGLEIHSAIIEDTASLKTDFEKQSTAKILFLGDSITSGGLDLFTNTYGFIMCEALGAEGQYICFNGAAVNNRFHNTTRPVQCIPYLFRETKFGSSTDYDFSWVPDVVVLSCGVNDGNPYKSADTEYKAKYAEETQKAYYDFLNFIHETYPNAKILYSKSAGISGPGEFDKNAILPAIQKFQNENPGVLEYFYNIEKIDTISDGWHPGNQTHARDGLVYAEKVKKMLGW